MRRLLFASLFLVAGCCVGLLQPQSAAADVPVCRAEVIQSYPNGTWLENLAQDQRGRLFYSVTSERKIEVYEPGRGVRHFADLPIYPMGIAILRDRLVISGNRRPMSDGAATLESNAIVEVSLDGKVGRLTDVPDARMLNGVALAPGGIVLIADSRAGKIWQYAPSTGDVTVWLADSLLSPPPGAPPGMVGANGLKLRSRHLLISNSGLGEVLSVPLASTGRPIGGISLASKTGLVDDFDVSADGSIIAAPYSTKIISVAPSGSVRTLLAEGADGATAVSVIHGDRKLISFYVLTTGGLLTGGKGPARLLKVNASADRGCEAGSSHE